MSEKIYAWLLRLYPSHFREAYGDQAVQLFRDRARHEKGFLPGIRLWLDLLADLVISVPREYRYVAHAVVASSAPRPLDGLPSFYVLESESLCWGALFLGGVLSLLVFGALSIGINFVGEASLASGHSVAAVTHSSGGDAEPNALESSSLTPFTSAKGRISQPKTGDSKSAMTVAMIEDEKLDRAARHRVILKAIEYLEQYYIDPDVAHKIADALLAHEKNGDYDVVTDGALFADLLTRQMRDVSRDAQLIVVYSQGPPPDRPSGPAPEEIAQYRSEMAANNCTFEKIKILPHNIGYLKLNSFPDPSICEPAAKIAMASLNHSDAIIFDLRDNRGGYAKMVALLATYLFDRPTHLNDFYNRGANSTEQSWTLPPVAGNRLADKPSYVLTSATSFSAAEAFSYDLKMLKRATLVGETTSGRSHMGMPHRIDDHFVIRVPGIRVINPISKTNWEGTGVEPDVRVKAADALPTAEKLALSKLQKK
jgi:Peptidase family S41/N-terminal domain of Peptidase_S41 in eukaryotic IRBP